MGANLIKSEYSNLGDKFISIDDLQNLRNSFESFHNGVISLTGMKRDEILRSYDKILSVVESGKIPTYQQNGTTYIDRADVSRFTPHSLIRAYDGERHILLDKAYSLVESQNDNALDVKKLKEAVELGTINVYEFKNQQFLDRLDIGRVYHNPNKEKKGVTIDRYFTRGVEDIVASAGPYQKRHLEIKSVDGKNIIWQMDAEFPESWDKVSSQIVAQKYFFNPNRPEWKEKIKEKLGVDHETSIYHLAKRVSNFFADKGKELGYFTSSEDKEAFRDELLWLQLHRKGAFNSPVQFNAGLFNEYGIKGSHGINYHKDQETGEVIKFEDGEYVYPQCHACFIKGPRDDLESIANHAVDEIGIFSAGSGIGQDIGALRGSGEKLSGGGVASGPLSYLDFYDNVAGSIKSGGKSRRAARMTTMRQDHPDILEFIRIKVREDGKALTLMKAGYSGGMDGEACTTVAFQNTNLSVRLDDYFFEQLKNGGDIELHYVNSKGVARKISAEQMMKEISFGAWRVGDPGLQYESKIQEMHTAKNSGRQNSTNPCGEYMFLNDTSCNLASLNLLGFADEEGNFDVKSYQKAARIFAIAQDIANDVASYPVKDIAEISPEFRTIGLGYANLGSLLMRKGLPYDSSKGRALAGALTAILTGAAYEASTELAEHLGTFEHYEFNKAPMLDVMKRHRKSLDDINWELVDNDEIKNAAYESWNNVGVEGQKHGFRNAQATVLAPTGTISFLMGAEDSTGIEPSYALTGIKNLAGGGYIIITNKEMSNALGNLGHNALEIRDILDYVGEEVGKDQHGRPIPRNTVIGAPHLSPEHYRIFETALGNGGGLGDIPFEGHVRMMGAAQPFISGGISKTNNMPERTSVKDVYEAFVLGHDLGLKGITIFRHNSKPSSAMSLGERGFIELKRGKVEEPLSERSGPQIEVKIGNTPFHMLVGEYSDGRPSQITFLSYAAGSTLKALLETHGISASKALKRGVNLGDVVAGWIGQKFEPQGMVTIENPRGPHQNIKMAASPLDFAGKWLKLNYLGDINMATEPEKVDTTKLRGYENGAFATYEAKNIDDWNFDQVINNPKLGGFKKGNGKNTPATQISKEKKCNVGGPVCPKCGNLMRSSGSGSDCFQCYNCAEKTGGCGG